MRQFISIILRRLTYVLAVGIIIIASMIAMAQLLTPYLNTHLPNIERIASDFLKKPVSINQVKIAWDRYQPVLSLRQVTIRNEKTNRPIIEIDKISIFVSLINSIKHFKLTPGGILIDGTALDIHQNAVGEISIKGFPSFGGNQPFTEEAKIREVVGWLFKHNQIILQNIHVRYVDQHAIKHAVTLFNLSMKNNGNMHVLFGKAELHQPIPTTTMLTVTLEGTAEAYEQIKGNAYLYVTGFSLSQWLKGRTWHGWQIYDGVGSAKVWASWKQGTLEHVQSIFQLYDTTLLSSVNKSYHKINRLSGHLGWKRQGLDQFLVVNDILINLPNHLWPVTSFAVAFSQTVDNGLLLKAMNIGYLDLSDVKPFLFGTSFTLPTSIKNIIVGTQLDGQLQHADYSLQEGYDWHDAKVSLNFSHLSMVPWQQFPGLNNISGTAVWEKGRGDIHLKTNDFVFTDNNIFANSLKFNHLLGDIKADYKDGHWRLFTSSLKLINEDISADANGSVTIPDKGDIEAEVNANFSVQRAEHIIQYLPLKTFSVTLSQWLKTAIIKGNAPSVTAQVKGKLKDFPFANENGVFKIVGNINNVELLFAPDWPTLTNISGKVVFLGNQMIVEADQATMMDIPIRKIRAEIPYLGEAKPNILYITCENIQSDIASAMAFIHASPLEKTIGKMFKDLALEGPLQLNLDLIVALAEPEKIKVHGALDLRKINLNLLPWDLHITAINGQVDFTDDSVTSTPLTGFVFNKPVTIQLSTLKNKQIKKPMVKANVVTHLGLTDITDWLKLPKNDVAIGGAEVKAIIDMAIDTPLNINLQSDLEGVQLNLPDQYAKKAKAKSSFNADITLQENKPLQIKVAYNKSLSAAAVIDKINNNFKLISANLHLGSGEPAWPKSEGIYITGSLDNLNLDKIKSYLNNAGDNSLFKEQKIQNISLLINKLDIFGQQLTSAQVEVIPTASAYQVNLNSPQVKGHLTIPIIFANHTLLNAQFDKLILKGETGKSFDQLIDFKSLPNISFDAKEVNYSDMDLGHIKIKTKAHLSGQTIESLEINSKNVNLHANGNWGADSGRYKTSLKGSGHSDYVGGLLKDLNVNAHNLVASKGDVNFNLNWNSAFISPDISSLNGDFSINLGPGRLIDIGDTNSAKMDLGKMLSLFSLQSIPRRLSLDFSDLFQKGYSFDSLHGDYSLTNGDLFTNNMRIDGPVAKVTINGRIGLSKKDVNFILNVTPYVTSSIPVAAGILTANPLIGIGAFAVNSMIGSRVVSYTYNVAGTWSDPIWQEIQIPAKH